MTNRATLAISGVCSLAVQVAVAFQAPPPEASDDIFYQIMPIAFRDGGKGAMPEDPYRFGDLKGIENSLDYIQSLGVNAIWMTPIFPSPAYHGYQHMPADSINPWFGTQEDFTSLARAVHERHMKIYIDLVAYGINKNSDYYKDAHNNPASKFSRYLAFTDNKNGASQGYDFKTWNGDTVGFVHWDLRNQEPRDLVTTWSKKWLDPNGDGDLTDGVDGFRLDHVWATYPNGPEGWGYNIDSFWKPWKAELRKVNPQVFTFAEQAKWETTGADLLPAHDAAFTKPFEFAAREAIVKMSAATLDKSLRESLKAVPSDRTLGDCFLGTLGDHDVDRLASALGADTEETIGRAKVAAAILLFQPFPPVIYSGDEIGMLGKKGNFGSDANDIPLREPFKWNAVADKPMTNYYALHKGAYKNRYSRDNDGRSVEEQDKLEGSLLETYRKYGSLRRTNIALRRGNYTPLTCSDPGVWTFAREAKNQTVIVAINLTGQEKEVRIDLSPIARPVALPIRAHELAGGLPMTQVDETNRKRYIVAIAPFGATTFAFD